MQTRHWQTQVFDLRRLTLARTDQHVKQADSTFHAMVEKTHISLRVLPIGHNTTILNAAHQSLNFRMIEAHHTKTVEWHVLNELRESCAHIVEIAVMVEVFGIDIGYNRDISWKLQERAVAFIRFNNHPVAIAHTGIGAICIDDAAIDHGRIKMTGIKQGCHH